MNTVQAIMETPEQRMRGGLFAVYMRWETANAHAAASSLSTAMAREAVQALAESYPDDPSYRALMTEIERAVEERRHD